MQNRVDAGWIFQEADSETEVSVGWGGIIREHSLLWRMERREGNKVEQREKLGCDTVSAEGSAKLTRDSGAEMALRVVPS